VVTIEQAVKTEIAKKAIAIDLIVDFISSIICHPPA
jgi:hypothetical protein